MSAVAMLFPTSFHSFRSHPPALKFFLLSSSVMFSETHLGLSTQQSLTVSTSASYDSALLPTAKKKLLKAALIYSYKHEDSEGFDNMHI